MYIKMFPEGIDYHLFLKGNIKQYCYQEPLKDKGDILYFLKHYTDQAIISGKRQIDPITGKMFSNHYELYRVNGLEWSNTTTFFFENYDIRLNDDFLKEARIILKRDIIKKT